MLDMKPPCRAYDGGAGGDLPMARGTGGEAHGINITAGSLTSVSTIRPAIYAPESRPARTHRLSRSNFGTPVRHPIKLLPGWAACRWDTLTGTTPQRRTSRWVTVCRGQHPRYTPRRSQWRSFSQACCRRRQSGIVSSAHARQRS